MILIGFFRRQHIETIQQAQTGINLATKGLMRSLTLLLMINRTHRLAVVVCNEQDKDIKNLKYENKKLQERIKLKQGKGDGTSVCKYIATDAKLRLNTGLPNKKMF